MTSEHTTETAPKAQLHRTVDTHRFEDEGLTFIREFHSLLGSAQGSFPVLDRETEQPLAQAHWNACLHVLVGLLGWPDPGLGLQRWYEREEDPALRDERLALLRPVFDTRDGVLDLFALQLWERGVPNGDDAKRRATAFGGDYWIENLMERFPGPAMPYRADPYHGGGNGLHLWDLSRQDHFYSEGEIVIGPREARRAYARIPRFTGWATELERLAERLPPLEGRSWHVDVVVEEVGWLGTFRRSRASGRWFQGRHRVHKLGIPDTPG